MANFGDISSGLVLNAGSGVRRNVSDTNFEEVRLLEFSSTDPGLVPASGGGTSNFLRADGTWAAAGGAEADSNKALFLECFL